MNYSKVLFIYLLFFCVCQLSIILSLLIVEIDKMYSIYSLWEIIVYSRSTINACFLLSHKWWTPLIKFMVGPTIHVRGESTHLWYSEST